jgi:hypothetical protein
MNENHFDCQVYGSNHLVDTTFTALTLVTMLLGCKDRSRAKTILALLI